MRGSWLTRAATAFFLLAFLVGTRPLSVPMAATPGADFARAAVDIAPSGCTGCEMARMSGGLCHMACTQVSAIESVPVSDETVTTASILPSDEIAPVGRALPPILAPPRIS